MKHSGYWAWKYVLWLLLVLSVLLLIVLPLVTSIVYSHSPNSRLFSPRYFRTIELIQTGLMQILTAAWFFFVGSCFASFLNVVAWRVPRGRSILGSSRCPHCQTKLTFRDNIPLLGWLKNHGRCRYCKTSISRRYFDVEVILGVIFLTVVVLTLVSGGINLPLRPRDAAGGFERVLLDPKWDLIQIVAHHLCLLSLLFTIVLIRRDDFPIPRSLVGFGVLIGISVVFLFPAVQIVDWRFASTTPANFQTFQWDQAWTLFLGSVVGIVCGIVVSRQESKESGHSAIAAFWLCGLFLGWQSSLSICLIVFILKWIGPPSDPWSHFNKLDITALILAATLTHLFFWRLFTLLNGFWPSPQSQWFQIVISMAILGLLAARFLPKHPAATEAAP